MTVAQHPNAKTGEPQDARRGTRRTRRTVRFSDREWKQIQEAAAKRGITASEYVRNAALHVIESAPQTEIAGLSPALVEIIKLTHRSAYILSTLKRDEMIREGRAREIDELVRASGSRRAQADIFDS